MPLENFPGSRDPENPHAEIWRFVSFEKFRDLIATGELYFCRADLFEDEQEGLPPEESVPILDPSDGVSIISSLGSMAQFREGFFVNCWHLFAEQTAHMWKKYGNEGVALCSRYNLLKVVLDNLGDRVFLSAVHYGVRPMTRWNILQFINTKRFEFRDEREVRAVIWQPDPFAGINRHFDEDNLAHTRPLTPPPGRVPKFLRRAVDLGRLLERLVVSPYSQDATVSAAKQIIREAGLFIPVEHSELARFRIYLP